MYCIGIDIFEEKGIIPQLLQSCRECNSLLGNLFVHDISGRKKFLYEKIKKRYKKVLKLPDWDEEEINEIGRSMKESLKNVQNIKKWITKRLSILELY